MASFKEASNVRPFGQSTPHSRQSSGRLHSHSISLGVVNTNHRVTRRKSMTSTAAANAAAAVAAALGESAGSSHHPPSTSYHRRGLSSRRVGLESTSMGSSSAFGSYLAQQRKHSPTSAGSSSNNNNHSTQNNQSGEDTASTSRPVSTKHRSRRASEGSHLIRGEGKRSLTELKCDRCGKGYKHSSCLTKHMWEHDPAWAYTSKLLISKHQQVQLLEAATVLITMNQDPAAPSDAGGSGESDRSSASPTASGISEMRDEFSSTETTPPPMGDEGIASMATSGDHRHHHRFGSSSAFSRSFQSVPSSSFAGSAPSYSPARSHFRHSSIDTRPSTADTGILDDDEAGLAAAIGLCNFGTPRTGPMAMSSDVPPVPPLPARYLSQSVSHQTLTPGSVHNTARSFDTRSTTTTSASKDASSTPTIFNPFLINPPLSYKISDERDTRMGSVKPIQEESDDHDFDRNSVVPMDEDDDGVFGKMEE